MPLSPPGARRPIHRRSITLAGYARADGLWDLEGHLVDTKAYAFPNRWRGRLAPGTPVHEMWLRLTLDDELTVRAVEAVTAHSPFAVCPEAAPRFAALQGERIGPGWRARVRELLGGVRGCTHIVELANVLAAAAWQTVMPARHRAVAERGLDVAEEPAAPGPKGGRPPRWLDQCYALASDGPVVRTDYPDWYTGA